MKELFIGKIVSTHGIKGELKLKSDFKYKNKVFIKDMQIFVGEDRNIEVINSYRPHKQYDMITLIGYNNINEVLKYIGDEVYIDEENLILDKDEYLDKDLINLEVYMDDMFIGTVIRIERFTHNSIIVIKNEKKEYLIPYSYGIIKNIDMEKRHIIINNIKGLIE